MNAPQRFARRTFTVWALGDEGRYAMQRVSFPTLPEIERHYEHSAYHGSTIFALEKDAVTDALRLHVYRIRKGKWLGKIALGVKVYPFHADKLFSLPVSSFEPTAPWQWSPGCDVVGLGDVIDAKAVTL